MPLKIRKAYRSSNVIGMPIKNPEKEDLGNIEEVVIDIESGSVAYAVLSVEEFFGFTEKFFAIPWSELTLEYDEFESYFTLDTSREKLSAMKGFNKKDWPDAANANWVVEVDEHYQANSRED